MDNVPNPVCRHRMVQGGERRMIIWLMMALTVGGLVFAGVIFCLMHREKPKFADYFKKCKALDHEIDKTLAEIQRILGINVNVDEL